MIDDVRDTKTTSSRLHRIKSLNTSCSHARPRWGVYTAFSVYSNSPVQYNTQKDVMTSSFLVLSLTTARPYSAHSPHHSIGPECIRRLQVAALVLESACHESMPGLESCRVYTSADLCATSGLGAASAVLGLTVDLRLRNVEGMLEVGHGLADVLRIPRLGRMVVYQCVADSVLVSVAGMQSSALVLAYHPVAEVE